MNDDRTCPTCQAACHFVASFGAPGVGQSWRCSNGHDLAKLGGTLIDQASVPDDEDPPWVLSLGDVM